MCDDYRVVNNIFWLDLLQSFSFVRYKYIIDFMKRTLCHRVSIMCGPYLSRGSVV